MSLSTRMRQIIIGLIVMAISLAAYASHMRNNFESMRAAQLGATLVLLFGIFKAHPAHKPKFLLFWLGMTTIYIYYLIYVSIEYFDSLRHGWDIFTFFGVLLPLLTVGVIVYMMNFIYKDYVELTLGPSNSESNIEDEKVVVSTES